MAHMSKMCVSKYSYNGDTRNQTNIITKSRFTCTLYLCVEIVRVFHLLFRVWQNNFKNIAIRKCFQKVFKIIKKILQLENAFKKYLKYKILLIKYIKYKIQNILLE